GFVQLAEPDKKSVLAFKPGQPVTRCAAAIIFDRKSGAAYNGVVDIGAKKIVSWIEQPTKTAPYGQPPVIIEEFFLVGDVVKKDPGWRAAVKRR
ncbi:hypothetical protein, partial [Enterococcus faecium]|uniref:hypothetical protein n=1 Tax=Enterococcus faecium TaxID=1352 RepID=UPI003F428A80